MDADTERRIRERAYEIWLREGKPQGRHAQHWEAAQAEIAAEDREKAPAAATKPSAPPKETASPEPTAAPVRSRRATGRAKAAPKPRASSPDGHGEGAADGGRRDR